MSNIVVPLLKDETINFCIENGVDGFVIGIENFSENFNRYVSIYDIKRYCNLIISKNKKVFIALNKSYFNDEIPKLKEILFLLDTINISGVMFVDFSILNIINENNLKINPILYGNHYSTNSFTINFLEKRGLKGVLLSDEITMNEKLNIINKINIDSFITLFGYTNIATSSRGLLSNYFEYIKSDKKESNIYYIKEKGSNELYPIVQENNTNIFSSKILNGIKEFSKIIGNKKVKWIFLNDYMISENSFCNVIEAFNALKKSNDDSNFVQKLYEVVESNNYYNTYDGFFNKETIFKVKNNE